MPSSTRGDRSVRAVRGERLSRQGLGSSRPATVADAVRVTTAIQAQDGGAARLGVRVRSSDLTEAGVVASTGERREVVRTWLLRGTVHLVAAQDLRWLVRLIGPSIVRRYRTRWRQLGLTNDVLDTSLELLPGILAAGPLTRREVLAALAEQGLDPTGDATDLHTHVLVHASAVGLVCRAHDRGRDATFALVDHWLPGVVAGPSEDDALAELARRYFAAYSPATAADFATWSGLAAGPALALVRDELTPVDIDGAPGFRLGTVQPERAVRLLPAFDNYVLGYRDRSSIVPPSRFGEVYQGGMIRATVVADGAAIGTWRLDRARGRVRVEPFEGLRTQERRGVESEVADLSRFLDRELETTIAPAE